MLELEGRNGKGGVRQHRRPRCQMHRRLLLPRHQHLPDLILFWRKEKEGYGEEQICEISREADGRYVRIIRVSKQQHLQLRVVQRETFVSWCYSRIYK